MDMVELSARQAYFTDISDKGWALIEPNLPRPKSNRGTKRKHPLRELVNGIFYIVRSGCVWRLLPHDFPPWQTVYYYFRDWRQKGIWEQIMDVLRQNYRIASGREPDPSAGVIDTQSVKSTATRGIRGYDGFKKVKGRKRHILVDTQGTIIKAKVHAANVADQKGAKEVLTGGAAKSARLSLVWTDGGYTGPLVAWAKAQCDIDLERVKPLEKAQGFQLLPRRWVVERTFAWFGRYRRLSKEYEELTQTSEAMIYVTMNHILIRRMDKMKTTKN